MKIYAVLHEYNNGLSYDDYEHWEDYNLFSDFAKASQYYWGHVSEDYEGQYTLMSWELNTQKREYYERSEYIPCTPDYGYPDYDDWEENNDLEENDPEDFYDYTVGARRNPAASLDAAWEYIDLCEEYENYERNSNPEEYEEYILGKEAIKWLNTPHAINISSKKLEEERNLIEGDKLITELLLDSLAKEFCKEYNEYGESPLIVGLLIAKYREKYEKLGYANAWIGYLKKLNII